MRRLSLVVALGMALPLTAAAMQFSDVTSSTLYADAILRLANVGVVQGNPDGTFRANDPVNRAQMLTLLYRATKRTPAVALTKCFKDVPLDQWFANVVCDAAAKGYVVGYADGTFGPEKKVNRVETLKMMFQLFAFPVEAGEVSPYSDVYPSAWFQTYVASALERGILPLSNRDTKLQPEVAVIRGEAAELIARAMGETLPQLPASSTSTSSTSSEKSSSSVVIDAQSSSSRASATPNTHAYVAGTLTAVSFPFARSDRFGVRGTTAYVFTLDAATLARLSARSSGRTAAECRLYRIGEEGLSYEYYLPSNSGSECWARVHLEPGTYQFEITADADINVELTGEKASNGDGNDGFVDAKPLERSLLYPGDLLEDDYADFFTFSVTRQSQLTFEVKSGDSNTLQCIVYPLEDVAMYGFTWPACNEAFLYEKGTYVVALMHSKSALKLSARQKETYSVRLK